MSDVFGIIHQSVDWVINNLFWQTRSWMFSGLSTSPQTGLATSYSGGPENECFREQTEQITTYSGRPEVGCFRDQSVAPTVVREQHRPSPEQSRVINGSVQPELDRHCSQTAFALAILNDFLQNQNRNSYQYCSSTSFIMGQHPTPVDVLGADNSLTIPPYIVVFPNGGKHHRVSADKASAGSCY